MAPTPFLGVKSQGYVPPQNPPARVPEYKAIDLCQMSTSLTDSVVKEVADLFVQHWDKSKASKESNRAIARLNDGFLDYVCGKDNSPSGYSNFALAATAPADEGLTDIEDQRCGNCQDFNTSCVVATDSKRTEVQSHCIGCTISKLKCPLSLTRASGPRGVLRGPEPLLKKCSEHIHNLRTSIIAKAKALANIPNHKLTPKQRLRMKELKAMKSDGKALYKVFSASVAKIPSPRKAQIDSSNSEEGM